MENDKLNNNNNSLLPHQVEEQSNNVVPLHDRILRDYPRKNHFEGGPGVRRLLKVPNI